MAITNGNGSTSSQAIQGGDAVAQLLIAARHTITQARLLARDLDPTLKTASLIAEAHEAVSDALDYRVTHR